MIGNSQEILDGKGQLIYWFSLILEQQNIKLPDNTNIPIGERFTKLACQAYQQFNKISRSRLAKLLGVSLSSIGNILTTYGFTETDDEEIQINHT